MTFVRLWRVWEAMSSPGELAGGGVNRKLTGDMDAVAGLRGGGIGTDGGGGLVGDDCLNSHVKLLLSGRIRGLSHAPKTERGTKFETKGLSPCLPLSPLAS